MRADRVALTAIACAPAAFMLLAVSGTMAQAGLDAHVQAAPGAFRMSLLIVLGLVTGICLGMAGSILERPGFMVAGAGVLLVAAVPMMLGASGYVVLVSVPLLVLAARNVPGFDGTPRLAAGALGMLVSAAWITLLVNAIRMGPSVFIIVAVAVGIVPGLMLLAAFWPRQDGSAS